MMDQAGIDILAHMRTLALKRIESLNFSLFHLEDSLPILVSEYNRMIAEHKAAIQYEMDALRRHDAHMMGAMYAPPGQVGPQAVAPEQVPQLPPFVAPPTGPMLIDAQTGLPLGQAPMNFPPNLETARLPGAFPQQAPPPGMSDGLGRLAQAVVGAQSTLHGAAVRQAIPIPQSKVSAVMYQPGESRPPEALPGHLDPNGPEPRSAEELIAARDAQRIAQTEPLPAPVEAPPSEG